MGCEFRFGGSGATVASRVCLTVWDFRFGGKVRDLGLSIKGYGFTVRPLGV